VFKPYSSRQSSQKRKTGIAEEKPYRVMVSPKRLPFKAGRPLFGVPQTTAKD